MKTVLTSIAFALAATASQALVFDFSWSSAGSTDPFEGPLLLQAVTHGAADPVTATGTIEIDANPGETFTLGDIVASNIAVKGPGVLAFTITDWTSAGGMIAADGLSAMFSEAGNPFSKNFATGAFFGCQFGGCSDGTIEIQDTGSNFFFFDFGGAGDALASMKMTRTDTGGPAPVPLPAGGLLLIGALGALGLARRRT